MAKNYVVIDVCVGHSTTLPYGLLASISTKSITKDIGETSRSNRSRRNWLAMTLIKLYHSRPSDGDRLTLHFSSHFLDPPDRLLNTSYKLRYIRPSSRHYTGLSPATGRSLWLNDVCVLYNSVHRSRYTAAPEQGLTFLSKYSLLVQKCRKSFLSATCRE
jgi:hypothetical protein